MGKRLTSWRQAERDASRAAIAGMIEERRRAFCRTAMCFDRELRRVEVGVWSCAAHWPAVVS